MNTVLDKKAQHKTVHLHRLLAGLVASTAHCVNQPSTKTTERLRSDFIASNKLELIELANLNFMSFALYAALKQKNLLQYLTSDEANYLKDLFELNTQRNREFIEEVNTLIQAFNKLDIEVVLIKGAAALLDGWYQDIGERFLRDVDLLLPKDKAQAAFAHLKTLGYELVNPLDENLHELKTHQLAALHKKDSPLVIELHIEPITLKAKGILSAEAVFAKKVAASETQVSKLNLSASEVAQFFFPCPEHNLLIALVHTEIGDNNRKNQRFFLRHGMDVERILKRYDVGCVQSVNATLKKNGYENLLTDYFQVMDFFFSTNALQETALEHPNTNHLNRILDKLIKDHQNAKTMTGQKRKRLYLWQQVIDAFSKEKITMRYDVRDNLSLNKYRVINLFRLLKKYTLATNRKNLIDSIDDSLATKNLLGKE